MIKDIFAHVIDFFNKRFISYCIIFLLAFKEPHTHTYACIICMRIQIFFFYYMKILNFIIFFLFFKNILLICSFEELMAKDSKIVCVYNETIKTKKKLK